MAASIAQKSVVLLIEDRDATTSPCEALIDGVGATCYRVRGLEEAEEVLHQNTPDVVIVDHELSDGTGIDLISVIRQGMEQRNTPIIFLTGEIDPRELERAVMMGIYAFLAKPFNGDEFVKLLTSAIVDEAERIRRDHD